MSNPSRPIASVLLASLALLLAACGGGGAPEHLTFEVTIANGALASPHATLTAHQGDTVTLVVNADEALTFHLHGYDEEHEVMPNMPTTIKFVADATGSFPFVMHIGAHSHDDGAGTCEATLPAGAPTPQLHLSAVADAQTGMVMASVEVEHFVLGEGDGSIASGHWHLMADGATVGMYMEPSATVMLEPGVHELVATLSNDAHCDYPVSASVIVGEGAAIGEGMAMDEQNHAVETESEVNLGRLDVLPR